MSKHLHWAYNDYMAMPLPLFGYWVSVFNTVCEEEAGYIKQQVAEAKKGKIR